MLCAVLATAIVAASVAGCALPTLGAAPAASPAAPPAVSTYGADAPATVSAPASAPAPASTPLVPAGFYRVSPGDTQRGVARAFGREPALIAQWNHLSPTDGLRVGQVLRVAPPLAGAAAASASSDASASSLAQARALFAQGPGESAAPKARFAWPVSGAVVSPFEVGKTKGVVLSGRVGEPVRAASAGHVVYAGGKIAPYGKLIIIKHDAHLLTAYGNNRALLVKEGADVKAGDVIAEMGADGKGQAALRFEVRSDGKPVDPLKYLPKRQ